MLDHFIILCYNINYHVILRKIDMAFKLWICEKPSVAKDLAKFLNARWVSAGKTKTGYYVSNDDVVVGLFGHMLEMQQPGEMNQKWQTWTLQTLPIYPLSNKLKIRDDAAVKQVLKNIETLLVKCDSIVNVGDVDREGQLLVDEILDYYGNTKSVQRLWCSDMNAIAEAATKMRPNTDYIGYKMAAELRQQADFIFGMTFTRAFTIIMQKAGHLGVFPVGRVQTPVLRLVYDRYMDLKNFKPIDFFEMNGLFDSVTAKLKTPQSLETDEEGRVINKAIIDSIAEYCKGQTATVTKSNTAKKSTLQSPLHSLSSLQASANQKLGFGVQKTLDIAQKLYEVHKVTTYPRTDCQFATTDVYAKSGKTLDFLSNHYESASKANKLLKSWCFNDSKVTAHYAIVPTGFGNIESLNSDEKALFDLIATQYIIQFYPKMEYTQIDLEFTIPNPKESLIFRTSGRQITNVGWKAIVGKSEEDEENNLPLLKEGSRVVCSKTEVVSKKTTPPSLYTEGSLVTQMINIHNVVDKILAESNFSPAKQQEISKEAKQIFKDAIARGAQPGIGTEATRAGIVETLKARGYIELKGKSLIPTDKGIKLISAIKSTTESSDRFSFLISPLTTARYESLMGEMVETNGKCGTSEIIKNIEKDISAAFNFDQVPMNIQPPIAAPAPTAKKGTTTTKKNSKSCPNCSNGTMVIKKGKNGPFWGCNNYPNCKTTANDDNGKPKFK